MAAVVALGCSSREVDPGAASASGASLVTDSPSHDIIALVARAAVIRPVSLVRTHAGFVARRPSPEISVLLPPTPSRHLRIETTRRDFWVEIGAEDVSSDAEGVLHGPVLVFAGALPSTDITFVAGRDRIEELRLLRGPSAPTSARYRVRLGPAVAEIRMRNQRVELVDPTGYVGLSTDPMFAIDARGVRRELAVSVERSGRDALVTTVLDTAGLSFPIAVDPVWTTVPSMAIDRYNHALTLLPSGEALVAGGGGGGGERSSAEIYDPVKNVWKTVASMSATRSGLGLVTLSTGKVLAAGGSGGQNTKLEWQIRSSTELFDPVAGTWVPGAPMASARADGAYVVLKSGKVLATGGQAAPGDPTVLVALKKAETYDPVVNAGSATGDLNGARYGHAVAITGAGAMVAGGGSGGTTAELWSSSTGTWATPSSPTGASLNLLAALPGDKVLVVGPSAATFDPGTLLWTKTPGTPTVSHNNGTATRLLGGKVLLMGGSALSGSPSVSELFDPSTGAFFATTAPVANAGANHAAVLLATGAVLVTGGTGSSSTAEIYHSEVGTKCALATECVSGFCVDGVCCESACGGQCEACDIPASAGKCLAVYGAPHGTRAACPLGADICGATTCDGTVRTACQFPPSTSKCSANACKDGKETHESLCDGKGACGDVPKTCGTYACGSTACKTTCTVDGDCASGFYCKGGGPSCVPIEGLGSPCTTATTCTKPLFCTDGFCCLVSACAGGASCGLPGKEGKCTKPQGSTCAAGADCGSGLCVDGVCCDTVCDGQCEACDVPDATTGRPGRCTPVKGAPHGSRTKCASGAADPCANATCDGASTRECKGFPGSETECRPPSCKDAQRILRASCDGKGTCPKQDGASCSGYSCNAAGTECKTRCDDLSDCAPDHVCKEEKCVPRTARCSDDGSESIPATGAPVPCSPFRCGTDGTCSKTCATALDCAPGFGCDSVAKACAPPTSSTGDSGGCSITNPRRAPGETPWLLALVALGVWIQGVRARLRRKAGQPYES